MQWLGSLCIALGLATLTEGWHFFRQWAERAGNPLRYWWIAGAICATGLGLMGFGFGLE